MDILWFATGYVTGRVVSAGRASSENQPVSQRYALFITKTEDEALQKIREAFANLYEKPPEVASFNSDGDLVTRVQRTSWHGRAKKAEESDSTVSIDRFLREQLLKVELYDSKMRPHGDNIMLARYLADNSRK